MFWQCALVACVAVFPYVLGFLAWHGLSELATWRQPAAPEARLLVGLFGTVLMVLLICVFAVQWFVSTSRSRAPR